MDWSKQQQAAYDAIAFTKENIMLGALAGTGKTTTLGEIGKILAVEGKPILFCAFNKSIVGELERRLTGTGVVTKTFHSLGFGILAGAIKERGFRGQINVDGQKYRNIVKEWAWNDPRLKGAAYEAAQDLPYWRKSKADRDFINGAIDMAVELLNMLRLHLVQWDDEKALTELISDYRMDDDIYNDSYITRLVLDKIPQFMSQGEKETLEGRIDFTDQLYWSVYGFDSGLSTGPRSYPMIRKYAYVLVDEAQDLSPVQQELIRQMVGERIILVGDRNQAIYFFAGADARSFDNTVRMFNATVMPLTLTFRCPKIITQHAAQIVKEFQCPEDKEPGKVAWINEARLTEISRPGDAILCRKKAPLVSTAFSLIAEGIPATILGRDIGAALTKILKKLQKYDTWDFSSILTLLNQYREEQVTRYRLRNDTAMVEKTIDECGALYSIISNTHPDTLDQLLETIASLFSESPDGRQVVLSTIHKAKGLEFPRVMILNPQSLPLNWDGMGEEQQQQERNLDYIARTRATKELVYLINFEFLLANRKPEYVVDTLEGVPMLETGK